jgi:hypothetical protein
MIPARLANELWHAAGFFHRRRFLAATQHPESTQAALLRSLLRRHASTQFGRAHRFDQLRTVGEFQDVVPLSDHHDYEDHLERIARGEPNVLTRDPVTHFIPTSGSTAACKLIPWTAGLQRDFNRAIGAWTSDLFTQHPDLKKGRAYWSVSPSIPEEQDPHSKIPIGFEDDTEYLGSLAGKVIRSIMAVPSAVRHVSDTETFRYLVLLHLVAARSLRLVSVWHPTFFTLLLDSLPAHFESIVRTIHTGVIDPPRRLPDKLQRQFQRRFHPDPERARELRALDPARPDTIWPHMQLLSAWGDHESPHRTDLTRRFPKARFQPKGLLATEAVVTIPFAGTTPLALNSHFFEFLDEAGEIRLAHQLEASKRYEVVVTTSGGLYRYRLRDQVDVTGFLKRTPCLRFVGRAGRISDLCGEKLDEQFVQDAVDGLTARPEGFSEPTPKEPTMASHSPSFGRDGSRTNPIRFRLLAADTESHPPGYTLFLVADPVPDLQSLAARLEAALCQNPHYRLCRFLGQLRSVQVRAADPGSIDAYFAWRAARGQNLGDIKPTAMDSGPGLLDCFAVLPNPASRSWGKSRADG